jgi:small subunit ribosomal protein S8
MVVDQISNLIISLKNASKAGKASVTFTHTKLKSAILDTLVREGYISSVEKDGKGVAKSLTATLAQKDKAPAIEGVKRVSKFSRRIYKGVSDIKPVKNGFGTLILSTPKGILSDKEARKVNIGGEALFEIW